MRYLNDLHKKNKFQYFIVRYYTNRLYLSMKHKERCPVCNGTGKLEIPKHREADMVEVNQKIAKDLVGRGYSYRQVMRVLGYKSVRSVQYLLDKV
jgi:hypothetical protein